MKKNKGNEVFMKFNRSIVRELTEKEVKEQLIVHPGSGSYIAKVLNIRYPNMRFTVPEVTGNYIFVAPRYRDEPMDSRLRLEVNDAISVLTIAWQLSGGKIGEYIHE